MSDGRIVRNPPPTPMPRAVLCPYCGSVSADVQRCAACGGHLDALSRQATQNSMGPWFVRDQDRPYRPGCSYETLCKLAEQGRVKQETVIRGPTTGQFWMLARRVPGLAHRLGVCHSCQLPAAADEYACRACGAVFQGERDRQHLGLGPKRPLPGQESAEMVAARLAVTMPDVPTPVFGGAKKVVHPTVGRALGHVPTPIDAERLRRLERRAVALRSRLIGSLSANIVLACAVLVAVVLLAVRDEGGRAPLTVPGVRDPLYVGPLGAALAGEGTIDQSPTGEGPDAAPGDDQAESDQPLPVFEPAVEPEPVAPERELDITLMNWQDAQTYLRARVDENDAESVRRGLEMLGEYERAGGLGEEGLQLRAAWEFRLEQLRLQGLP